MAKRRFPCPDCGAMSRNMDDPYGTPTLLHCSKKACGAAWHEMRGERTKPAPPAPVPHTEPLRASQRDSGLKKAKSDIDIAPVRRVRRRIKL